MAYWNSNVYPAQPMPYNYDPYNVDRSRWPPQQPTTSTPEKASGSGGCVAITILVVLLVAAAFVIPVTLALTNTGPFSTSTAPPNTTTTTISTSTTASTVAPWSQCSSYLTINDSTRLITSGTGNQCDQSVFSSNTTWVRFLPPGGTQLSTITPSSNQCGTLAAGWYNGTMPSTGMTVNGTVCYSWTSTCTWTNPVRVTNCGPFYVFGLTAPPGCSFRYCTM